MRMKKYLIIISTFLCVLCTGIFKPVEVFAADGKVSFDAQSYSAANGDTVDVTLTLQCENTVGLYDIEVVYDRYRLRYEGGGTSEADGVIRISGSGSSALIEEELQFTALSGGVAEVFVRSVSADIVGSSLKYSVSNNAKSAVHISGADTVMQTANQEQFGTGISVPLCGTADVQGNTLYIVNLAQYMPDGIDWTYGTTADIYQNHLVTYLTASDNRTKFVYLMDESGSMYLYSFNSTSGSYFPCYVITAEGQKYYYTSAGACTSLPDGLNADYASEKNIYYTFKTDGSASFCYVAADGRVSQWDGDMSEEHMRTVIYVLIGVLAILFVIVIVVAAAAISNRRYRKKSLRRLALKQQSDNEKASKREAAAGNYSQAKNVSQNRSQSDSAKSKTGAAKAVPQSTADNIAELKKAVSAKQITPKNSKSRSGRNAKPVIEVKNVTMKFRIATFNSSGIKEYLIQKIKGNMSYRELTALDDVSFNVYKGEVVGIIGTNGSGKSTLLRIVSGALRPTSGEVKTNRKRLQLLTLGTGFDFELTARENVYLNGAIIGYTKEFIDENYDKIVKFAELEDFMEEKVKNFSSGMVSRLGFAIATVGDAADILILDEVLSVGDEFFRKKSLARIKEMIHSGSTVLMVSHSLGSILENCTKVVWIEKGRLKMIGEPKEVCEAYRRYGTNEA